MITSEIRQETINRTAMSRYVYFAYSSKDADRLAS